jgi:hypothetical protein
MPPWDVQTGVNIAQYGNELILPVHFAAPSATEMENPMVNINCDGYMKVQG